MGELDLCIDCYYYDPLVDGARAAMITVLLSWAPLVAAGIGLNRRRMIRPAMRGAGLLRLLARVAITILVAAVSMPLLLILGIANEAPSLLLSIFVLVLGSAVLSPIIALSFFGIRAWHRVLQELTSPPGERRLLV